MNFKYIEIIHTITNIICGLFAIILYTKTLQQSSSRYINLLNKSIFSNHFIVKMCHSLKLELMLELLHDGITTLLT